MQNKKVKKLLFDYETPNIKFVLFGEDIITNSLNSDESSGDSNNGQDESGGMWSPVVPFR